MTRLADLTPHCAIRGMQGDNVVTIVSVTHHGKGAVELTHKDATGRVDSQLLYRSDEAGLEIVETGQLWEFDGDGALFRLVCEAQRIRLAHLRPAACRLCIKRRGAPYRTRSRSSTKPYCHASRCVSCSPMIRVQARPSQGC